MIPIAPLPVFAKYRKPYTIGQLTRPCKKWASNLNWSIDPAIGQDQAVYSDVIIKDGKVIEIKPLKFNHTNTLTKNKDAS